MADDEAAKKAKLKLRDKMVLILSKQFDAENKNTTPNKFDDQILDQQEVDAAYPVGREKLTTSMDTTAEFLKANNLYDDDNRKIIEDAKALMAKRMVEFKAAEDAEIKKSGGITRPRFIDIGLEVFYDSPIANGEILAPTPLGQQKKNVPEK